MQSDQLFDLFADIKERKEEYTLDQIEILEAILRDQAEEQMLDKEAEIEEFFTAYEHGLGIC